MGFEFEADKINYSSVKYYTNEVYEKAIEWAKDGSIGELKLEI